MKPLLAILVRSLWLALIIGLVAAWLGGCGNIVLVSDPLSTDAGLDLGASVDVASTTDAGADDGPTRPRADAATLADETHPSIDAGASLPEVSTPEVAPEAPPVRDCQRECEVWCAMGKGTLLGCGCSCSPPPVKGWSL